MTTTPERAKQLAAIARKPGDWNDATEMAEAATVLEAYAGMMGAALPERILDIETRHTEQASGGGAWYAAMLDRATLLDAVRVLTAERDKIRDDATDEIERLNRFGCKAVNERDEARADAERLNAELADWRDQFDDLAHAKRAKDNAIALVIENDSLRESLAAAETTAREREQTERLAVETTDRRTLDLVAMEDRADRLAEGVRLMRAAIPNETAASTVWDGLALWDWERKHGHLVTK